MSDTPENDRDDTMTGTPEPGSNAADAADNAEKKNASTSATETDVHGEPENPSGG
ncbi:hypothetical protein [Leifsonia sp. Leaf264]|uniref:hypothetical protein n=1 Tax=Leifsonia sp. Leaf264 TaxID=1736314 RepID=UPI000B16AEAA|nr:hypothetical protein [Leifsonia sp. Leaf264]